jgi:hypothetical protein
MTIPSTPLGDVSSLGIYMTDPNLNLNDPNNTDPKSGLGGGLLLDLDPILVGGVGFVVPQTDTSSVSFTGKYAFGAQSYAGACCEYDFVGQGSVTSLALVGSGLLSDPFLSFGEANSDNTGVSFKEPAAQADGSNPGRYSLFSTNSPSNPFTIKIAGTPIIILDVGIYQVSGEELLWLNEDPNSLNSFFGLVQQMGSLTGIPTSKPAVAKPVETPQKP